MNFRVHTGEETMGMKADTLPRLAFETDRPTLAVD